MVNSPDSHHALNEYVKSLGRILKEFTAIQVLIKSVRASSPEEYALLKGTDTKKLLSTNVRTAIELRNPDIENLSTENVRQAFQDMLKAAFMSVGIVRVDMGKKDEVQAALKTLEVKNPELKNAVMKFGELAPKLAEVLFRVEMAAGEAHKFSQLPDLNDSIEQVTAMIEQLMEIKAIEAKVFPNKANHKLDEFHAAVSDVNLTVVDAANTTSPVYITE